MGRMAILWLLILLPGCSCQHKGGAPPAPDAAEAPQWGNTPKAEKSADKPSENGKPAKAVAPDEKKVEKPPALQFTPSTDKPIYNLPLQIVVTNVPEVPENIRGPLKKSEPAAPAKKL